MKEAVICARWWFAAGASREMVTSMAVISTSTRQEGTCSVRPPDGSRERL